jgi:hypothetical protein
VQLRESSPNAFAELPWRATNLRELDLPVREATLKRREAALRRIQRALAGPRVAASYFDAGHNPHEDDWWAKQLGREVSLEVSSGGSLAAR